MTQKIGSYDQWMVVEATATDTDTVGDTADDWFYVTAGFFSLEFVGGGEAVVYEKIHSETTYVARTHYVEEIKPHMRLRLEKREFQILFTYDADNSYRELVIECKERNQ